MTEHEPTVETREVVLTLRYDFDVSKYDKEEAIEQALDHAEVASRNDSTEYKKYKDYHVSVCVEG